MHIIQGSNQCANGSSLESYTVKMNMPYLINKIVATDYKQYYLLN